MVPKNFWSHVDSSAANRVLFDGVFFIFFVLVHVLSHSKVGQLDLNGTVFLLMQQNILRLQVTMHNVKSIELVHGE